MRDFPLAEVILREWFDIVLLTRIALTNGVEGDSEGSSLTRAALILLYAMIDAQLSIVSQWKLSENLGLFETAEIAFLNEIALGVGHDGEPLIVEDHQAFKQRIIAVPRILARRVCQRDVRPDLGQSWGADLMKGHALRNQLVHSPLGTEMPRITISELLTTAKAVKQYFEELVKIAEPVFGVFSKLLESFGLPPDAEIQRDLSRMREYRKINPDRPVMFSALEG